MNRTVSQCFAHDFDSNGHREAVRRRHLRNRNISGGQRCAEWYAVKRWNGGTDGSVESVAVVHLVNVVIAMIDENVERQYVDHCDVSVPIHVDAIRNGIDDYVDCGRNGFVADFRSSVVVSWKADCHYHPLSVRITAWAATLCVGARFEMQR